MPLQLLVLPVERGQPVAVPPLLVSAAGYGAVESAIQNHPVLLLCLSKLARQCLRAVGMLF